MIFSKYRIHLCWLVPLLIFDAVFFTWLWKRLSSPLPSAGPVSVAAKPVKVNLRYPTDRELDRGNTNAFQPTASGRPESGFYGSVRTVWVGKRLVPSFHEGVDIAPVERGRTGNPRDIVFAAANGEVAYVNRQAGNSNYGKYVVLFHGGEQGRIYTLYAHLAEIGSEIRKGVHVEQGNILGMMGSTSTDHIPPSNGHLHFEVCLMLNSRFQQWFKRQKLVPDHGLFNGWNLIGIDPLAVYEKQEEDDGDEYDIYAHLAAIPRAYELVLKAPHQLDFFRRYPSLWHGAEFKGGAMVIACSENGLPLNGRCAGKDETIELGRKSNFIRSVDRSALGRNGCRLVVCGNGKWRLGAEGEKWRSILIY